MDIAEACALWTLIEREGTPHVEPLSLDEWPVGAWVINCWNAPKAVYFTVESVEGWAQWKGERTCTNDGRLQTAAHLTAC